MRVLVLGNLYPPHFLGGYELLCAQVVAELRGRGHEVAVLTSSHGSGPGSRVEDGVRVHRLLRLHRDFPGPARASASRRWRVARHNRRITRRILEEEQPDRVFVWSQLRLTLEPAAVCEEAGLAVAYTLNDYHLRGYLPRRPALQPGRLLHALGDRTLFRGTTLRRLRLAHVTCISHTLKETLARAGVPVGRAEVHWQGIPVDRFPPKAEPGALHRPLRILYAGQLHPYKGVHVLLRALRRLQDTSCLGGAWQATLVGTGPESYRTELAGLATDLPVRFAGLVPPEEMPALYREHDVLVFPSLWEEPFGLTHLEAMASGTVVVSTPEGGPGEFLRDGRDALLFPAGDDAALATALERLAADSGLAATLARAGRARVLRDFSLCRYAGEMEDFLLRTPTNREPATRPTSPPLEAARLHASRP